MTCGFCPLGLPASMCGPGGLLGLTLTFRLQGSVPPEENGCFGEWIVWHYMPQRSSPSQSSAFPRYPGFPQLGAGNSTASAFHTQSNDQSLQFVMGAFLLLSSLMIQQNQRYKRQTRLKKHTPPLEKQVTDLGLDLKLTRYCFRHGGRGLLFVHLGVVEGYWIIL